MSSCSGASASVRASSAEVQPCCIHEGCIQETPIEANQYNSCTFCSPSMKQKMNTITGAIAIIVPTDKLIKIPGMPSYQLITSKFTRVAASVIEGSAEPTRATALDSNQPFFGQEQGGIATAFAVTRNSVMTTAHSFFHKPGDRNVQRPFSDFRVVFDFTIPVLHAAKNIFHPDEIYAVRHVFMQHPYYNENRNYSDKQHDWAWVILDKDLVDITPLSCSSLMPSDSRFLMIGHPKGLPAKHTHGTLAHSSNEDREQFFNVNISIFAGNSGSPVMNENGNVVGIMSNARSDYHIDSVTKKAVATVHPSRAEQSYPSAYKIENTMLFVAKKMAELNLYTLQDRSMRMSQHYRNRIEEEVLKPQADREKLIKKHMDEVREENTVKREALLKARNNSISYMSDGPRKAAEGLNALHSWVDRWFQSRFENSAEREIREGVAQDKDKEDAMLVQLNAKYNESRSTNDPQSKARINMRSLNISERQAMLVDGLENSFHLVTGRAYSATEVQQLLRP